jgi:hypothetical protein
MVFSVPYLITWTRISLADGLHEMLALRVIEADLSGIDQHRYNKTICSLD